MVKVYLVGEKHTAKNKTKVIKQITSLEYTVGEEELDFYSSDDETKAQGIEDYLFYFFHRVFMFYASIINENKTPQQRNQNIRPAQEEFQQFRNIVQNPGNYCNGVNEQSIARLCQSLIGWNSLQVYQNNQQVLIQLLSNLQTALIQRLPNYYRIANNQTPWILSFNFNLYDDNLYSYDRISHNISALRDIPLAYFSRKLIKDTVTDKVDSVAIIVGKDHAKRIYEAKWLEKKGCNITHIIVDKDHETEFFNKHYTAKARIINYAYDNPLKVLGLFAAVIRASGSFSRRRLKFIYCLRLVSKNPTVCSAIYQNINFVA